MCEYYRAWSRVIPHEEKESDMMASLFQEVGIEPSSGNTISFSNIFLNGEIDVSGKSKWFAILHKLEDDFLIKSTLVIEASSKSRRLIRLF